MKRKIGLRLSKTTLFIFLLSVNSFSYAQQGFTRADRDLLIEMRARLMGIDKRFEQVDRRFEQVDKRFTEMREDMNERFEQVDRRFTEMREDMNERFEQVDKRFEQVDKRFEQVNNRFEEIMTFIGILAALFGAITLGTISFALWDRKTMIRPFETKVAKLTDKITTNSKNHKNLVFSLKEYASKNKTFADTIQRLHS